MIPPFDGAGNLPPGVHAASWSELVERFATTSRRRYLLEGLRAALESLRDAGCRGAYLGGSFVTTKKEPGDFDGCWDPEGVVLEHVDPVLLTFDKGRAAQKAKYRGELFPASLREGGSGVTFLDFFQTDRDTGAAKGIVFVDLRSLEP
jgi:hypothetical protein